MRLLPRLSFVVSLVRETARLEPALLRVGLGASALCALVGTQACMQATQTFALVLHPSAAHQPSSSADGAPGSASAGELPSKMVGSLSVERIEGGQRLVVLQLEQLPPPERIAPGIREFVVWLEDSKGSEVRVGTLRYDRASHSGNLLATTDLRDFTVRVTGERDARAAQPTGVLLAERRVVTN